MNYELNLEPETYGNDSGFDGLAGETYDYDEFPEHECETCGGVTTEHECEACAGAAQEYDEADWEGELQRGRRTPLRPVSTQPSVRRTGFRPRVVRPPNFGSFGQTTCICPSNNCPQHGSEYVRWVQSALNQVLNLRLPVTGIMDAQSRSAVRNFQEKQGLPVDGIAGPDTKEALMSAKAGNVARGDAVKPAEANSTKPSAEFDMEDMGLWKILDQFSASSCRAFKPIAVENPGGERIKDKRIPASTDIVVIQGAKGKSQLHHLAADALKALVCTARADGIKHPILLPTGSRSGFRDPRLQKAAWERALKKYGTEKKARKWVAKPGFSAHQSGRAIDFFLGLPNDSRNVGRLRQTHAYKWMVANAQRFGFYPYPDEPWHWEYNPPVSRQSEFFSDMENTFEFESNFENKTFEYQDEVLDETEDSEYESAFDVLSPSEIKAVKITSTFETGRAGSFGGLTGNFDGQGLSFGLLNFTINAGSLIPLLKEFINRFPARYISIFGTNADQFKEMVFATKKDPKYPKRRIRDVERQMEFVNTKMNLIPRKTKSNKIVEPWKTYFSGLENDSEFRKIQVNAVRRVLVKARKWFDYFGFKTERGLAFMFDLVSSHGGAWLDAQKFKSRRRKLLQKMLALKKAQLGRETLSELEKMEVIANMIANDSLPEWREKVRVRKLWFVHGTGKVHGHFWDIKKDFGITDNMPDFGSKPNNEFEFADESFYGGQESFERSNASPVPSLVKIDKTAQGATFYCKIGIGLGKNLNQTGIYVPNSFNPNSDFKLLVYLHGHKGTYPGNTVLINGYWDGARFPFFALREEVSASKQNTILIAPSLGSKSQAGSLVQRGGFDNFIKQVLIFLNDHYMVPQHGRRLNEVQDIILAAHSGGGSPMLRIAKGTDQFALKIKECWCFDSMYGSVANYWIEWAKSHPDARLHVYYGPAKIQGRILPRDNAEAIACASKNQGLTNVCVQPSRAKSIGRGAAHFWVPKVHLKERLLNSPCLAGTVCSFRPRKQHSELEVPASIGIDWLAVKNKAVALAKQEYERWDRGQRHETNPRFTPVLEKYWIDGAGVSQKKASWAISNRSPWSAAFISWIMKTAGVGKYFKCSAGHHRYVSAAKKNKVNNITENPFWAYRISEVKPKVGDLICNSRCDPKHPERCGATYENVDKLKYPSLHCDIVVDVKSDHVLVIGGNTGDQYGGLKRSTVGMKKVLLNDSGKVRDGQKTNYIAVIKFRTSESIPMEWPFFIKANPFDFEYDPYEDGNEYFQSQELYEFDDTENQFGVELEEDMELEIEAC